MGKFRDAITPAWVRKYLVIYREQGFKGFVRTVGWKIVLLVFLFYLVRDTILYILIPYLVAKGVFQF